VNHGGTVSWSHRAGSIPQIIAQALQPPARVRLNGGSPSAVGTGEALNEHVTRPVLPYRLNSRTGDASRKRFRIIAPDLVDWREGSSSHNGKKHYPVDARPDLNTAREALACPIYGPDFRARTPTVIDGVPDRARGTPHTPTTPPGRRKVAVRTRFSR